MFFKAKYLTIIEMNEKIDFTLSPKNMKNISFHKYTQDFTFIVNGKRYETTRIVADILSPYVRKLHFIDDSINEFSIKIKEIDQNCDYFLDFLNLCTFEIQNLDSQRQEIFSKYFYNLGNIEEYIRIHPDHSAALTIDNVIDRLQSILNLSDKITNESELQAFNLNEVISFISSHFEEIDKEMMKNLPIEIIEEILNEENLRLKDEDSLLNFILTLYENNSSYSVLFEYIYFNNVSEKSFESFISLFKIECINSKIWDSICRRILAPKKESTNNNSRYHIEKYIHKAFKFQKGKEFNGILRYLTEETGGNIHDNGTIEITSNSIADDNICFHPKHLVDYKCFTFYESKNDENAFVCFDFKNNQIKLSNYSIKSHKDGFNRGNLRNWVVEISNDGKNWKEIDHHENDPTLNRSNFIANFTIKNEPDFCRFIRIRQTGCSWHGYPNFNNYYIYFYFIEFFGDIRCIEK